MRSAILHIRKRSNPTNDFESAIRSNVNLLDALYRLSFTADKLTVKQVDELVNSLQRKPNEIVVLLERIVRVKQQGFSLKVFQDT